MKRTQNQKDLIIIQIRQLIQTLLERTSNDKIIIENITSLANDHIDMADSITNSILRISIKVKKGKIKNFYKKNKKIQKK